MDLSFPGQQTATATSCIPHDSVYMPGPRAGKSETWLQMFQMPPKFVKQKSNWLHSSIEFANPVINFRETELRRELRLITHAGMQRWIWTYNYQRIQPSKNKYWGYAWTGLTVTVIRSTKMKTKMASSIYLLFACVVSRGR